VCVIVPEGVLPEWGMPLRGTGGRAWTMFESRKKLETRKRLKNAAESHTSGTRFVGRALSPSKQSYKHLIVS
jgi:hypothetical protein